MVLQNKYKARASRKYNAERGGASSSNGRGRGNSRGRGRGRGAPHSSSNFNNDDDQENSQDEDDDSEQHSGEEEEEQDPNFPSLASTSKPKEKSGDSNGTREPSSRSKYSRRKLESNSWRYQEEEKDPYEESDPEPEVDLTNLIARVSSLSANDTLSLSNRPSDQEERRNLEDDIDRSLAYLHSKERDRRNPNSRRDEDRSEKLVRETGGEETEEERERMRLERELMRKDKEKAEALRALKERFQHRNIGDRESPSSNSKAKVLRIGTNPQQAASKSPSPSTAMPQNHRQSSFTTSFGRNPGSISGASSSVNASRKTSSRSSSLLGGEDDIDTFLDSLSKPVNLSPSKTNKDQEKRELNSIKMSPGLSKESISSSGSRSRSRFNSIGSQDNKNDIGNGNLSPDNFQEMFQTGASCPKNQGSIGKGRNSRKDEMLDKLKFVGSSKDEGAEGEKPKAKVENLEDFLDGMLG